LWRQEASSLTLLGWDGDLDGGRDDDKLGGDR
jgi:hypothetical protein